MKRTVVVKTLVPDSKSTLRALAAVHLIGQGLDVGDVVESRVLSSEGKGLWAVQVTVAVTESKSKGRP